MSSPYFANNGVGDLKKAPEPKPSSSVKCTDCKSDTQVSGGIRRCVDPKCDWWSIVPAREQQIP